MAFKVPRLSLKQSLLVLLAVAVIFGTAKLISSPATGSISSGDSNTQATAVEGASTESYSSRYVRLAYPGIYELKKSKGQAANVAEAFRLVTRPKTGQLARIIAVTIYKQPAPALDDLPAYRIRQKQPAIYKVIPSSDKSVKLFANQQQNENVAFIITGDRLATVAISGNFGLIDERLGDDDWRELLGNWRWK